MVDSLKKQILFWKMIFFFRYWLCSWFVNTFWCAGLFIQFFVVPMHFFIKFMKWLNLVRSNRSVGKRLKNNNNNNSLLRNKKIYIYYFTKINKQTQLEQNKLSGAQVNPGLSRKHVNLSLPRYIIFLASRLQSRSRKYKYFFKPIDRVANCNLQKDKEESWECS